MNHFKLFLVAAIAAVPTLALADPITVARCASDQLSVSNAHLRIEWARQCSLTLNTGSVPNTGNPANYFLSGRAYDLTILMTGMLVGAKEYRENSSTTRPYTSSTFYNSEINYTYVWGTYTGAGAYTVFQDPTGYYKWTTSSTQRDGSTQNGSPYYPIFATNASATGTQLFPHPTLANCNLYTDKTGTTPYTGTFAVVGYCEGGCYTPDQSLRFSTGDVNIVDALNARRNDIVTLSPDATLDDPRTQVSTVYSYTRDLFDASQPIIKLTTASGGSLNVTNAHPVLISNGRLVRADKLREGDDLLKADGTPDPITRIARTHFWGKVYNLRPTATEHVANILIAQGFLVGSARFQNEDVSFINRTILFGAVPDEVMPK